MLSNIICEANKNCVWIHSLRFGLEAHFRPATCIHWARWRRKHPHLRFCAHSAEGIARDKVSLVLSLELRVWRRARWFISLTEPEMWAAWHRLLTSAQHILRFKRILFPYLGLLWPPRRSDQSKFSIFLHFTCSGGCNDLNYWHSLMFEFIYLHRNEWRRASRTMLIIYGMNHNLPQTGLISLSNFWIIHNMYIYLNC